MSTGHYVYKYVHNGEIVYIGKTDVSVTNRVKEHRKEICFRDYAGSTVFYIEVEDALEASVVERILIARYKPVLNTAGISSPKYANMDYEEPDWQCWGVDEYSVLEEDCFRLPDMDAYAEWQWNLPRMRYVMDYGRFRLRGKVESNTKHDLLDLLKRLYRGVDLYVSGISVIVHKFEEVYAVFEYVDSLGAGLSIVDYPCLDTTRRNPMADKVLPTLRCMSDFRYDIEHEDEMIDIMTGKMGDKYKDDSGTVMPEDFGDYYDQLTCHAISKARLAKKLGISRPTLYRFIDEYEAESAEQGTKCLRSKSRSPMITDVRWTT